MKDPNEPCLFCNAKKQDTLMITILHMLAMTLIQLQNTIVLLFPKDIR